MASSAALALPAWGNRWERGLDANGSPTRSYVWSTTTSTTDHYRYHTTAGWPRRSFRGISIGSRASYTIISPARVSSFFPARFLESLTMFDTVLDLATVDRSSWIDSTTAVVRRTFNSFGEIATFSHDTEGRALQFPSSFLSSSLLRALIRRTSGNRVTKADKIVRHAELKYACVKCVNPFNFLTR